MVPIVNRHFFEYQFSLLKENGINEVVLSICHLPHKIKAILGTGKKYGMSIKYAVEDSPLGTGGAIKNAERFLDETTVVMNGDILTDIDLKKMIAYHKKHKAIATIALHQVEDPTPYGLVETDKNSRVLKFLEKPNWAEIDTNWINAGIYIFNKKMFGYIPEGKPFSVERQVYPNVIKCGENVMAYKSKFYWLDIGKLDKYVQGNFDVLEGKFREKPVGAKKIRGNVHVGKKTKLAKGSFLSGPVFIGENCSVGKSSFNPLTIVNSGCVIGQDCQFERSIIWENVKIGDNVTIMDCVIGRNSEIQSNTVLKGAVIGDSTVITHHSKIGAM
jgi:NDP-sugar pyrophosphorylase family protein